MEKINAKVAAVAILLLVIFTVQSVHFLNNNTYTYDESVSVINGYYYLATGDLRMGLSQPPISAYLSAVPLFFTNSDFEFSSEECRSYDNWACAQQNLFERGNDADQILFLARLMSLLAMLATGVIVFLFARDVFGDSAALLSLALFSFSPVFLSSGLLALTNGFLTLFITLNVYLFYKLIKKYSLRLFILFSVTFGLSVATKFTAFLLIPGYVLVIAAIWKLRVPGFSHTLSLKPALRFLSLFAAIVFMVMWATYLFQFTTLADSTIPKYVPFYEETVAGSVPGPLQPIANTLVYSVPLPFPTYFSGIGWQVFSSTQSVKRSFFFGEPEVGRNLLFFPVVIATKMPLALFFMLAISLMLILRNKTPATIINLLVLLLPTATLLLFFMALTLNSGIQHLMPVIPLWLVLAGRCSSWLSIFNVKYVAVALLLAWYVTSSISVAPHSLAYFNELAGGPENGHKILGVPNFDWGQDLKNLKEYQNTYNTGTIKLSYFGTADPSYYNLDYEYLPSPRFQPWDPDYTPIVPQNESENCAPQSGTIAVSATNYYGIFLNNQSCYQWLREYEPIAKVGYSIFIYNVQ